MTRLFIALLAGVCLAGVVPAAAKSLTVKNLAIHKSTDRYEISVEYPATGNAAIDREIAAFARQEAADFVKLATTGLQHSDATAYGLDVSFEVARNDDAIFAVIFSEESATGGAHPNHDLATFNFEVPSGWRLFLPEIFDGRKALAKISGLAVADLSRQIEDSGGGDTDWVKRGAGPQWSNFHDFILQKETLEIRYPDYQVAPYAAGEQQTDIPLADLRGLSRSDRHAPAASFDCAAAGTAVEKAICSDVALARLDRDVAEAYVYRLDMTSEDGPKEALKSEQRAWLGRRDAACPSAAAACLTRAYSDRLKTLKTFPD